MKRRAAPALGFVALVAVLFPDVILRGGTFFQRDIQWVWYPQIEFVVRTVARGTLPWWNPFAGFGMPALADPSYQLLYPPTWLNFVIPPWHYYSLFVVGHCLFAACGVYRLGRAWGLERLGAFAAGGVFIASGPFLSLPSLFHHFAGLAWMPWSLWAVESVLKKAGLRACLVLAMAVTGQILAGSGDMCLMSALIVSLRVLVWATDHGRTAGRGLGGATFWILGGVTLALGVSAVQWMMTASTLASGSRLTLDAHAKLYWSVHPTTLLDIFVPQLVADTGVSSPARQRFFEGREPFMRSLFLGVGGIAAGIVGVITGHRLHRWMGVGAAFFLLCALGRHFALYPILAQVVPFSILRYPVKYTAAVALLLALLAGRGIDRWGEPPHTAARRAGLAVLAFAALIAFLTFGISRDPTGFAYFIGSQAAPGVIVQKVGLAGVFALVLGLVLWVGTRFRRSGAIVAPIAVACLLAELAMGTRRLNNPWPVEAWTYRPSWLAAMPRKVPPTRIYSRRPPDDAAVALATSRPDMRPQLAWDLWLQDLVAAPRGARWELAGSFDGDPTGLAPRELPALSAVLGQAWGRPEAERLLALASVERVISYREEAWLGPALIGFQSVAPEPVRVYPVRDPLPRAFLVTGVRQCPRLEACYGALLRAEFDPRREAILDGTPSAPPKPDFDGAVQMLDWRADVATYATSANSPAHLVVNESFDDGWTATVDGRPAAVARANLLFRSVPLDAGKHVVTLRYRPRAAQWGAGVSVASLLVLAALAARDRTA